MFVDWDCEIDKIELEDCKIKINDRNKVVMRIPMKIIECFRLADPVCVIVTTKHKIYNWSFQKPTLSF